MWDIYLITRFGVKYHWVFSRVVPFFDEPVGRVKIQSTSKNSQQYYTSKRLIRDLLSSDFFSQNSNLPSFLTFTRPVGMEEYKYRVIFVLVSRVICTLRSRVTGDFPVYI